MNLRRETNMVDMAQKARRAIERFRVQPAFSCFFGSAARGELGPMSDIDVGVYFSAELALADLGGLCADLEEAVGRSVDLLELAGLWRRRPELSYRVACEMHVLTGAESEELLQFRKRSFLEYMDTEPLRRLVQESLKRRLAAGRVGERNYVG